MVLHDRATSVDGIARIKSSVELLELVDLVNRVSRYNLPADRKAKYVTDLSPYMSLNTSTGVESWQRYILAPLNYAGENLGALATIGNIQSESP